MYVNPGRLRIIISLVLLVGITYLPKSAFSQGGDAGSNIQNLLVNSGFEGGFQEDFGIGYGWGGFSNGNAVVGWNFDDWDAVVVEGKYAQRIEIKNALDLNRYAGIYQTVSVIPGEQYKLTVKGLIRSEEGDISLSDYGYRLQYAIDYEGDIAWELVTDTEWKELPWDEQPLADPPAGNYQFNTFETTITAKSDKLTLFIRGWKKWLNNGSGIYDLDEITIIGPAPAGFQAPVAQTASAGSTEQQSAEEVVAADFPAQVAEHDADMPTPETQSQSQTESQPEATAAAPAQTETTSQATPTTAAPAVEAPAEADTSTQTQSAELPVSGRGSNETINYVVFVGVGILVILFIGAFAAIVRQHNIVE